jgi:predicted DNA-binding transcriptional regulator AlpA
VSRTTLWRRVKAGQFPAPVNLFDASPTLFWRLTDLLAWEARRAAACPQPAIEEAQP